MIAITGLNDASRVPRTNAPPCSLEYIGIVAGLPRWVSAIPLPDVGYVRCTGAIELLNTGGVGVAELTNEGIVGAALLG